MTTSLSVSWFLSTQLTKVTPSRPPIRESWVSALVARKAFALVILDVMLPGIDGFEVLERLRHFSDVPVLMLTTRGAASDRIRGLKSGADDYLPKPFEPDELFARVKSILRRIRPSHKGLSFISIGDIELDERFRRVTRGGDRRRADRG